MPVTHTIPATCQTNGQGATLAVKPGSMETQVTITGRLQITGDGTSDIRQSRLVLILAADDAQALAQAMKGSTR
jgi:hypothetical protein